jgi:hypothetical protein
MYGLIACGFAPCHRQNLLENPYTNPIGTGSENFFENPATIFRKNGFL